MLTAMPAWAGDAASLAHAQDRVKPLAEKPINTRFRPSVGARAGPGRPNQAREHRNSAPISMISVLRDPRASDTRPMKVDPVAKAMKNTLLNTPQSASDRPLACTSTEPSQSPEKDMNEPVKPKFTTNAAWICGCLTRVWITSSQGRVSVSAWSGGGAGAWLSGISSQASKATRPVRTAPTSERLRQPKRSVAQAKGAPATTDPLAPNSMPTPVMVAN